MYGAESNKPLETKNEKKKNSFNAKQ